MSGLLFHLITFPYISRILHAGGIGQVQFFQSIINYVVLCTSLGIPLYAIREVAKVRDNQKECSKITIEIVILHSILTFIGYFIISILVFYVDKISSNSFLFILLSLHLLLNTIGVYWFYQGIEDFKYVAIRALIVRVISMFALFIFVREETDLLIYAIIIVVAEAGNNIYNFIRLRKFVDCKHVFLKDLDILKHLKPASKIFVLNLVISIYVNLDTVMLGFIKNETAVGYYAAATRITKSLLAIVQSLGGVLLPRFSNLVETGQKKQLNHLSDKSLSFILALSIPLTLLLIFMASPIINLFCGNNFEPSIRTIQIMAPIIFCIAVSNIAGPQLLFALGKEELVIKATLVGAIINVFFNFILIPSYSQYGAGISTTLAEFIVMVLMLKYARSYININIFSEINRNYFYGAILMFLVLFSLNKFNFSEYIFLVIGSIFSSICYCSFLLFRKDPTINMLVSIIKNYHK